MTAVPFWVTVFSLLLLPAIPLGPDMPAVRLDDVAPLIWLYFVCMGLVRFELNFANRWRVMLLGVLAAVIPVSIAYGTYAGFDGSTADFVQLVRMAKYFAVYLMAVAYLQSHDPGRALGRISFLGFLLFGIAVSQYFNFLGLNESYVEFVAPTQFDTLVNNYPDPRPVGMIGNPNELGFLFVILAVVAIYRFSRTGSVVALLLVIANVAGVAITLSRGAMAAVIVALLAYAMRSLFPTAIPKLILKSFLAIMLLALLYVGLFHTQVYDQVTWRFVRVLELSADASFAQRMENWRENLDIIENHLLLGVGPLRRVAFEHAADNEWLLMLRSYGLTGTLALVAFLVVPSTRIADRKARIAAWSLVLATFVYMIPASVFHSLALFPVCLVFFAALDHLSVGQQRSRPRARSERLEESEGDFSASRTA